MEPFRLWMQAVVRIAAGCRWQAHIWNLMLCVGRPACCVMLCGLRCRCSKLSQRVTPSFADW
jgi:hypothetical protein